MSHPPTRELPPREVAWDPEAVALHRTLVAERLRAASCFACGSTLTSGTVGPVRGGFCLIEEWGLSDLGLARLLGRTENLSVACGDCGAPNRVVGPSQSDPC